MDVLKNQNGRSMIEMLCVLAIIGVLSVGGIAGYSKAMDRHRINETVNQVSHIVQNTRNLFLNQPNVYRSMDFNNATFMSVVNYANHQLAEKTQIFPTSIKKNGYKNLFGGEIKFFADGRFTKDDGKAFIVEFYSIPQEACIELATRDWQGSLGLVAMRIEGSKNVSSIQESYSKNCKSSYKNGDALICAADMPVPIEKVVVACDKSKDNHVRWKFY